MSFGSSTPSNACASLLGCTNNSPCDSTNAVQSDAVQPASAIGDNLYSCWALGFARLYPARLLKQHHDKCQSQLSSQPSKDRFQPRPIEIERIRCNVNNSCPGCNWLCTQCLTPTLPARATTWPGNHFERRSLSTRSSNVVLSYFQGPRPSPQFLSGLGSSDQFISTCI